MYRIVAAESAGQFRHIGELFAEYSDWLGISACHNSIEEEITALPGEYGPPEGGLWLAVDGTEAVGCIALRTIAPGVSEIKRLYVRPAARGQGLGKGLVLQAIQQARAWGHTGIRLDTIAERMTEATALYRELGFEDIEPYHRHVSTCTQFMELRL